MKKKIIYLALVIVTTSCDVTPPSPVAPPPPPRPTAPAANAPQQDWTFTVTINGTTHKAEGTYIYPYFDVATGYYFELEDLDDADNIAYAENTQYIELSMLDKSEPTYISGDHIDIQLDINNLSLGVNNIEIRFSGSDATSQTIVDELPFIYPESNPNSGQGFQHTQGTLSLPYGDPGPSDYPSTFPINITDLGSQKEVDNQNYNNPIPGNTIKGNYSGTVYSCDTFYYDITTTPYLQIFEFNTPTQISIDFEAIREY